MDKRYQRGPEHTKRWHHRVLTPDGGIIMCTTENDADRVVTLCNGLCDDIATYQAAGAELLKLAQHYAGLLNMHDGGKRALPETFEGWRASLQEKAA